MDFLIIFQKDFEQKTRNLNKMVETLGTICYNTKCRIIVCLKDLSKTFKNEVSKTVETVKKKYSTLISKIKN